MSKKKLRRRYLRSVVEAIIDRREKLLKQGGKVWVVKVA